MGLRVLRGGRRQIGNVATYVGEFGTVFYDENTGTLRLSDGVTPGGINNVLPIATTTELGAVKAGPGVNITSEGEITIDASGLPIGFGDFFAYVAPGPSGANAAYLSSVVTNQDIVLQSNGTGSVSVEGEFNVFATDGPLSERDPAFNIAADGQVTILVPVADPNEGAVKIVGSATGAIQTPVNTSVMLHVTGNNDDNSRIYMDAIGGYGGFVARRYNGTAASPTGVLENEEVGRFVANGRLASGWALQGVGRLSFYANQNQATNAQGGRAEFWITPNNSPGTAQVKTMSLLANSVIMHGNASVVGDLTVGNISATGITGTLSNGNSNVAIAANSNVSISANGVANLVTVSSAAGLTLAAGTTSRAPLTFTSGTNRTSPATGSMEYDGKVFYATPQDGERGIIATQQWYSLDSNRNLTFNTTTAQNLFAVSPSLSANTRYYFRLKFIVDRAAGTNGTALTLGWAGAATLSRISQLVQSKTGPLSVVGTENMVEWTITSNFTTQNAITIISNAPSQHTVLVTGFINVGASGGTVTPTITWEGATPAGAVTVYTGSNWQLWPVGSTGVDTQIGNWT